ncbi:MAG: hypothetical protein J5379_02975 [Clostridiales bacterium]|nr:hypothetical protein [Clostridiales bacterium]
MNTFAKKVTCFVLSLTMLGSMAACAKSDKKSSDVVEAANGVMDALTALNSKKLEKTGEFSEDALRYVENMKDNQAVSAVMKKASYEVDGDSVKESKKKTSVKVTVTLPDYEAALDDADGAMDAFIDAVDDMGKNDTKEIDLTLEFKGEDDEFSLSNGDDVVSNLYEELESVYAIGIKSGDADPTGTETEPTETEPVATETTPAPTETTPEPTPTPSPTPTPAPADTSSDEYDVVIFQDDNVIIHFIKVDSEGIHFKVENLTTFEITIQANALAIDGISATDIIMSDKIAGGTTGDALAKCEIPFNQQIGTISGAIRIVDFDNNFKTYSADLDNVVIDANVTPEAPAATGTALFADENVKISFKEINNDGIVFEVENLTAVVMGLRIDSAAINGKNYKDLYYTGKDIAPHSMGLVLIKTDEVDPNEAVGTVSGQFEINTDPDSFDYYCAPFNTVVVDANVSVTPPAMEGTPILDDANVTVTYKSLSDKGVVVNIENKTDRDLIVQAESLSINMRGIYDVYLSLHTAPHSVCEVVAKGEIDATQQVGTIGGAFIIADDNERGFAYMYLLDNVVIDSSVSVSATPEGTMIYEDSNVRIYYTGTTEKGLSFDVENLTKYNITMQADKVKVNGGDASSVVMSDDVAPYGVSQIVLRCKWESTDPVTTFGCEFRIFSWDNGIETYKAPVAETQVG